MKLMNSAMMPQPGLYYCREITRGEFCAILKKEHAEGTLENFVSYQQNLDLIEEWTGVKLSPSRGLCEMKDKDGTIVMRLNYRPTPGTKGDKIINEDDFSFFTVTYTAN